MSIKSILDDYLKTKAGLQKIRDIEKKNKVSFGHDLDTYKKLVNDLISCIIDFLPVSLKTSRQHSLLNRSSYVIDKNHIFENGFYRIGISFAPETVFRPSLVPEKWDGVPNIVLHLSNGWRANGSVSGLWHGEYTKSRRSYSGDPFMREAINEFNLTHTNATARLNNSYYR